MEEGEDAPPKRKFRLTLEEKNTIPAEPAAIADYINSALSLSLAPKSLKKSSTHCQRQLSHYDSILVVVQSAAVGQKYVEELQGCESHVVRLLAGKAGKLQQQAVALVGATKVVAIGSPAALLSVLELGALHLASKAAIAIDGRTNLKGYNLFHQRPELDRLRALFTAVFEANSQAKCLILNSNATLTETTGTS